MHKIKEHTTSTIHEPMRFVDFAIGLFDEVPTKSSVKKAIKSGRLKIDDHPAQTGTYVTEGMRISLYEVDSSPVKPYPFTVKTAFEDEHLLIVIKPPGLPTSGNQYRNLENALAHQFDLPKPSGYLHSPKPVHRLDSLTSGLVICAKTYDSRFKLGQLFENGGIRKTYHALVMGQTPDHGQMTHPVAGKKALTTFSKVESVKSLKNEEITLLRLSPETGRTHQLRIHCAEAGFPIYGDQLYAEKTIKGKGLFLACTGLKFTHPITGQPVAIETNLPTNFHNRMQNEERRWKKHHP